jgi:hypothetical protein
VASGDWEVKRDSSLADCVRNGGVFLSGRVLRFGDLRTWGAAVLRPYEEGRKQVPDFVRDDTATVFDGGKSFGEPKTNCARTQEATCKSGMWGTRDRRNLGQEEGRTPGGEAGMKACATNPKMPALRRGATGMVELG